MPKLKTCKAVAKRFKITKTGKVMSMHAGKSHILTKKSRKRKRFLRRAKGLGGKRSSRTIKKLLPYG